MNPRGRTALSPLPLVIGAAVAALTLIPFGYVLVATVDMGLTQLLELLLRPRVGELLSNTVLLLLGTVALSLVLGVGGALAVVRTDVPFPLVWHALLSAPLAIPAFVNSYGWVSLTHAVQSYPGAVLVVSLSYYPLVYLPVVASLSVLDAASEEVAWSLGRSRVRTVATVVLPRIAPAVLGGALLVALHVLAEFGALQLLAFQTFTTAIYGQYRSAFASEGGTVLAGVLVTACVLLLTLELLARGRRRWARVGSGTGRPAEPVRLGRARLPVVLVLVGVVALTLGVPLYALGRWLVLGSSTEFVTSELASAFGSTLGLAAGGALLTTLLALAPAWLAVRRRGMLAVLLERATYTANALPGIVVALALVWVTIRVVPSIYQTLPVLLAAYAILFLPRAVVSVRSSLEHAPVVLEEISHSLGQSSWNTFRRVTVPLVAPGLGAGAALTFLAISTELTATLILAPTGTSTLATEFWSDSSAVRYGAAAPYALLLILVSLPATWLLARQAQPRESS
ncbi:ABC transporter permease [Nocardioides sp.]|uniref:ABC transporter permease n=1 Tax=Nocardioides sp. TaxID=35761 RepID=UPI00356427A3